MPPRLIRYKSNGHDEDRKRWDIQDGEPYKWFLRFERYRLLGPGRTMQRLWNETPGARGTNCSPHWREASRKWHWHERAAAYDLQAIADKRRMFQEEAEADKQDRIRIIKAARNKLVQALNALDPATAKFSEVYGALKIVMDELRSEYDDQPTQRHRVSELEANLAITAGLAELARRSQAAVDVEDSDTTGYPFLDLTATYRDEEVQG